MPPTRRLLLFAALCGATLACGEEKLIERPPEQPFVQREPQLKASSIDILFVIDNSRSMLEEQEALASNFESFLRFLDPDPTKAGELGEVDYRLAVTTTDANGDAGRLIEAPTFVRPNGSYDPLVVFQRKVKVGTEGGALEQGLRAAELALERAAKHLDDDGQPAFLRSNAYLYVIVVSDEEDASFGEVRYYERRLETIKGIGNEQAVAFSAIAGISGSCETATEGKRYRQLAEATGGVIGDICTDDWTATLRELAVTGIGLRKRFQLALPPRDYDRSGKIDEPDILVRVRHPCSTPDDAEVLASCAAVERTCPGKSPEAEATGVACLPYFGHPDGWIFDAQDNAVVFDGAALPPPGSVVELSYFPRDA